MLILRSLLRRPAFVSNKIRTKSFLFIERRGRSSWCSWLFHFSVLIEVLCPSQNRIFSRLTLCIRIPVVTLCLCNTTRMMVPGDAMDFILSRRKARTPSVLTIASLSVLVGSYVLIYSLEKTLYGEKHSQVFKQILGFLWLSVTKTLFPVFLENSIYQS